MSSLTQASKVLSGLPRPLFPGNAMSMTEDSSFERLTCPNHLRRRVRSSTVASTKCNLASKTPDDMPSLALTPQIQRNIALSCCRSETFGAQVSPPLSIVGHTREFYTLNYTFNCPILLTILFRVLYVLPVFHYRVHTFHHILTDSFHYFFYQRGWVFCNWMDPWVAPLVNDTACSLFRIFSTNNKKLSCKYWIYPLLEPLLCLSTATFTKICIVYSFSMNFHRFYIFITCLFSILNRENFWACFSLMRLIHTCSFLSVIYCLSSSQMYVYSWNKCLSVGSCAIKILSGTF